jgi:IclR family transcriptional regulator, acetate operon repressor
MVKSADRTLDIFELFAREQQPMSLTDIARTMGVPLSSRFQLIGALRERGFVYEVDEHRRVYPTRKMLELATLTASFEPWTKQLEAKLARLRDVTQETTILGRRQSDVVLYLAVLEGPQIIRYTAHAGDRKPLHSSAIGKALLSAMEKDERDAVLARITLEKRTKTTITSKSALIEDLAATSRCGFAVTRGENVADVAALALPFRLHGDLYAIAIAGPMQRVNLHLERHRRHLLALGADLAMAA